jgi:hypothetical protein
MSNHKAIKAFVDNWRGYENFEVASTGNCIFPAAVLYSFDGKTVQQKTTITIIRNGYEDGKIRIDEGGVLSSAIFHLDFLPDFQEYQYKKSDNSFVVKGNSPKMHGAYTVKISPL